MKRFALLAFMSVSAIVIPHVGTTSAPAQAKTLFPVTIKDDQGHALTISKAPKRIVSLFADDTEILFALNVEKRVVGDGSQYAEVATGIVDAKGAPRDFRYPSEWPSKWGRDYPVKAPKLPHVEGGVGSDQFNLETIESLHPDLILAPYYTSQQPTYQKLHDLGFKVLFLNPSTIQQVFHDIDLVGLATGNRKQASTVVKTMKADLNRVTKGLVSVHSKPAVYYEIDATNPDQPYTAGPGTVPDQAIRLAKGKNIADTITSCKGPSCYPAFSSEEIVAQNPQVIVLADAAYGVTPDSVKQRPGYSGMAAVRTNRIYPINPDLLSRFGPRIVIGVKALAKLVHPTAFKKKR